MSLGCDDAGASGPQTAANTAISTCPSLQGRSQPPKEMQTRRFVLPHSAPGLSIIRVSLHFPASRTSPACPPGSRLADVKTTRFLAAALLAGLLTASLSNALQAAPQAEATDRIIVRWTAAAGEAPDELAETQGLSSRQSKRFAYGRPLGGRMSVLRLERNHTPA
ncbi:MAG: hypothetical protein RL030_248, partial [Pseudomonadota bacterium]